MGDFTIQISNSLIDRLVADGEMSKKKTKKTKKTKRKVPRDPENPQSNVSQGLILDDSEKPKSAGDPDSLFPQTAPALEFSNAESEAIQSVLQDSEKVVERLQKQEESLLQGVTQKAKDLHDKEYKIPNSKPIPCFAERDASLACYEENTKDPLKCGTLVTNFADCLRRFRQQLS